MFGNNTIVGRLHFKDAPKDSLMVTSRFLTLQGEGPFRGMPSYFIRLTKCNLACSFCDTYFDSGEYKTFDELLEESDRLIKSFYGEIPEWVKDQMILVITGGEPTIQPNLIKFLEKANTRFKRAQIESNGILHLDLPKYVTYVVSPKCIEKDGQAVKYLEPNKDVLDRADCLKFVVSVPENNQFSPYSEVPVWALEWRDKTKKEIFVSPMNIYLKEPEKAKRLRAEKKEITIEERSTIDEVISFWEPGLLDMEKNRRNHEYTALLAMKYGCTLNLQIHLFASLP